MKLDHLKEINVRATELVKPIRLLESIAWDMSLELEFLSSVEKGNPKLPTPTYREIDLTECRRELTSLTKKLSDNNPLEIYTKKTILSYIDTVRLIKSRSTKVFQDLSVEIFGCPRDLIPGGKITNIEAASKLLKVAHSFEHPFIKEPEACISAETVAEEIRKSCELFGSDGPNVEIVNDLSAKATASLSRVRLRGETCFNKYDAQQLIAHEVMIHVLTSINGSKQPVLQLMGRAAPRTTSTQEGLATFSEIITGAIDLKRLSRLALRIIAIDRCLSGADFIETFTFFQENGQSAKESFWSAARIFRGGNPSGGVVFTKDTVYLDGLFHVHALFKWALVENRQELIHLLFCGKVAIEDIFLLEKSLIDHEISLPTYLPSWYEDIESLAGNLAFSAVNTMMDLESLKLEFAAHEREPT